MNEYNLPKKFNWELASQPILKKYVADLFQENTSSTSGLLVVGVEYVINTLEVGDDFANVGFTFLGTPFTATGTTPTVWTNGTDVINVKLSAPIATVLANNTEVAFSYEYISLGTYLVSSSKPIFTGCGMGCPIGQHTQVTITNPFTFVAPIGAVVVFPISNSNMIILCDDGTTGADDLIGHFAQNAIEITIYPQS